VGQHIDVLPPKIQKATDALGELSRAFADLAQISGGSFGGVVQEIGQLVGALNVAQKAFKALENTALDGLTKIAAQANAVIAIVTIGFSLFKEIDKYTTGININGIQSQDIFAAHASLQEIVDQSAAVEAAAKQAGISVAEFDAALHSPDVFTAAGLDRLQKAFADLQGQISHTAELLAEASAKYGPSQTDLENTEKHLHELFDAMTQAGTYSADQLNAAYYAWQAAMAAAGNEAAKAWIAAHDAAESGSKAADSAMQKLLARRDELTKAISQEAPEEHIGVIEAQQRAERDAIEQQIADAEKTASETEDIYKQHADEWTAYVEERAGKAADGVRDSFDFDLHIPIVFDIPNVPVIPMASGGSGTVTKPTLFLAGEAGAEQFSFGPANRSSSTASGVTVGSVNFNMTVTENVDRESLKRNLLALTREDADIYSAIGAVADRRIAAS
jgi:hypothetical protein